jgi:hypothetical protein
VIVAGHLHVRAAFPDGPRLHAQLGPAIEHPYDTTVAQLDADRLSLIATELPGPCWQVETRFAPAETTWRYQEGRWLRA